MLSIVESKLGMVLTDLRSRLEQYLEEYRNACKEGKHEELAVIYMKMGVELMRYGEKFVPLG